MTTTNKPSVFLAVALVAILSLGSMYHTMKDDGQMSILDLDMDTIEHASGRTAPDDPQEDHVKRPKLKYGRVRVGESESEFSVEIFQRADYRPNFIRCSVEYFPFDNFQGFSQYVADNNSSARRCSVQYSREYFRENKRFLRDGAWFVNSSMFLDHLPMNATFHPRGCSLNTEITKLQHKERLHQCFKAKNISKILITGDSQGNRYALQLFNFVGNRSENNSCVRSEAVADQAYYNVPGKVNYEYPVPCKTCFPLNMTCDWTPDKKITVELISMNIFINPRLEFASEDVGEFLLGSPSHLELILRDYLPHVGFPDVWFLSPPTHHMAWFGSLEDFRSNVTQTRQLLEHYLPPTTKVFLLADIRECPVKKLDVHQRFLKEFSDTRGRNEYFNAMNQIVFDVFEDLLVEENSRYLAFLDVGNVLCHFTCAWHLDGGHLRQWVYRELIHTYFQFICDDS